LKFNFARGTKCPKLPRKPNHLSKFDQFNLNSKDLQIMGGFKPSSCNIPICQTPTLSSRPGILCELIDRLRKRHPAEWRLRKDPTDQSQLSFFVDHISQPSKSVTAIEGIQRYTEASAGDDIETISVQWSPSHWAFPTARTLAGKCISG
jgi:hypothetical protein